jgi:hypothetical protein
LKNKPLDTDTPSLQTQPQLRKSSMPYEQEISRQRPAYFIFLLDQSGSMIDPIGGGNGKTKKAAVAENLNSWIETMIVATAGSTGVKEYMDVSVIGYRTDENGEPIIKSALGGALAEKEQVGIRELADNPARQEELIKQYFDEETGEIVDVPYIARIWVEEDARGGTPMCSVMVKAYELAEAWTEQHSDSFPPIVINFSDGESTEGHPHEYAASLRSLGTNDGDLLLFNCHLSAEESNAVVFPSSVEQLPVHLDPNAETLFDISSVFPESMVNNGKAHGFDIEFGARGVAFNADSVGIIKFLDMGTRTPDLR